MQDVEIIELLSDPEKCTIDLCDKCGGAGWYWSTLKFGRQAGSETKVHCKRCDTTGRIIQVVAKVKLYVPVDYELKHE